MSTYHCNRRFDSHTLFDDGLEVGHLIHHIECEDLLIVPLTCYFLFFLDFFEDLRVVREMLECINQTTTHRVLRSEQEGKHHHRHLVIAEIGTAMIPRLRHDFDPLVEHTLGLAAVGHGDFTVVGGECEPVHGYFACLDCFVDFCAGEGEGEVDEFESLCDEPVFVGYFLGCLVGDVVSAEDFEGGFHVEVAADHHDGAAGVGGFAGIGEPLGEVFAGDCVLDSDVDAVRGAC